VLWVWRAAILSDPRAPSLRWYSSTPGQDFKEKIVAWWKKAEPLGEETYLLNSVMSEDEQSQSEPGPHMLHLIAGRYPDRLPELYETMLRRSPTIPQYLLAGLLGRSRVPPAVKGRLLVLGASSDSLEQRRAALWELFRLKHPRSVTLLIDSLRRLPRTWKGPYLESGAGATASLVTQTADSLAWRTLAEVAKESEVGLRLEMMGVMEYAFIGERQRPQRVMFLRQFLQDRSVRDISANPKAYEGPCAGFVFQRLAVRDWAAMLIAAILDLDVDPDPAWHEPEWASLRRKVQSALARTK
jgi:hypothetical protein